MKLSVQKKVSISSRTLFDSKESTDTKQLETDIKALNDKINNQLNSIKDKVSTMMKKSTLLSKKMPSFKNSGSSSMSFEPQIQRICESYKQIAHQVDAVSSDMPTRIQTIKSTVTTADNDLKNTQTSYSTFNKNKSNYSINSAKAMTLGSFSTTQEAAAEATSASPIRILRSHLNNT